MIRWLILLSFLSLFLSANASAKTLKVMVIDTGIDLQDPISTKYTPKKYLTPDQQDVNSHGTQVTSIIASRACADVIIIPCKYYEKPLNSMNLENEVKCIEKAIDEDVDLINYSSGGPDTSQREIKALKIFLSKPGRQFISAAGNNGCNLDSCSYYPACYRLPGMVAVASLDQYGNRNSSSNYSSWVKWEVGSQVPTTSLGGHMTYFSGTSAATALYTGKLVQKWCRSK